MSANSVLTAAADEVERWETHRADYALRTGAGGEIFCLLFETAKRLYGWTAIEHLQKHLRGDLASGQIQHWRETDRAAVVKALRESAGEVPEPDLEVATLRVKMAEFEQSLRDATGWQREDATSLVREIGRELVRLREQNERLTERLAEAMRRERHREAA